MKKHQLYMWMRGKPLLSTLLALYALRKNSELTDRGWFDSFHRSVPVDGSGGAIPWYTYSATAFLDSRVRPDMTVFEYGSGNSTLWWARRAIEVFSVEHHAGWYAKLQPVLPSNVQYFQVGLEPAGEYSTAIQRFDRKFDIVVVDGRERVRCAINSLPALSASGILIWDDTYRRHYRSGLDILAGQGFRRLDFAGLAPINTYGMCTSVFYRDGNCLGI